MEYITNCVSGNAEDLQKMVDSAKSITYRTFTKYVKPFVLNELFPQYVKGILHIKDDYSVSFFKGRYQGRHCVYVEQSGIEYIFC